MVVVYYVNTYYLDAAIETIQAIKGQVELHVVIELSPESKTSNIIDIDQLGKFSHIETAEAVLGELKWREFGHYFNGVASVHFAIHRFKKSYSVTSLITAAKIWNYIKSLKPDLLHFDSISTRVLGLYPFLIKKKLFITIHDPVPHTGEESWKIKLIEYLFYPLAKGLFFYSDFAKQQFNQHYTDIGAKRYIIRFQPFSYIKQFSKNLLKDSNAILFFGRILPYKGVDLLLRAIPQVLMNYPDQLFVIAGKPFNCELDKEILRNYKDNILVIPEHISTEELAALIKKSKFIVCPYRDATQSGVLMTTYALGKMVLGTNVGAFPEYIHDGINGLLTAPDAASIAGTIIRALDSDYFKELQKNVTDSYSESTGAENRQIILTAYQTS